MSVPKFRSGYSILLILFSLELDQNLIILEQFGYLDLSRNHEFNKF